MKILILLLIFFKGLCICRAGGLKTIERATGSSLVEAIIEYQKLNGAVPKSWNDLIKEEGCRHWIDTIYGNDSGFFMKYKFLAKEVSVIMNERDRIMVMGLSPLVQPVNTSADPPMRMIVIERTGSNSDIFMTILPESKLNTLFKSSGHDLVDFTGPNGKWEPGPDIETVVPKDSNQPLRHTTEEDASNRSPRSFRVNSIWSGFFAALLLALGCYVFIRWRVSKRSGF